MKHSQILPMGLLGLFFAWSAMIHAQTEDLLVLSDEEIVSTNKQSSTTSETTKIPNYFRHHRKLPVTYSGLVVELTTADLPLKRNHPLFKQFGNVHYDKLESGAYAYCILTNFSNRKTAVQYVNSIIARRAPEARVVEYIRGRRKVIKNE